MIKQFQLWLLIAAITYFGPPGHVLGAAIDPLDEYAIPEIAPGYQPDGKRDEKGIWFAMREEERRLQKSNLLIRDDAVNRGGS